MILSKNKLKPLINKNKLQITPFNKENLMETGIKLHLDPKVKKIVGNIDLKNLKNTTYEEFEISENGYTLKPNEYLQGFTLEHIKLPKNIWGLLDTRGSFAKVGLKLLFDYHVDPLSDCKLTIQIKNLSNNNIKIYPNLYAMRITFFEVSE